MDDLLLLTFPSGKSSKLKSFSAFVSCLICFRLHNCNNINVMDSLNFVFS